MTLVKKGTVIYPAFMPSIVSGDYLDGLKSKF